MMNKPEVVEEELDANLEPEPTPEPKEKPKGHLTKEEWESEGNNPEDYVSEEVWEAKGEWLKVAGKQKRENQQLRNEIDGMRSEFTSQLESRDKLHALGLENQIKALEAKMDEAIESGDVEAAKQIRAELRGNEKIVDTLNEPTPKATVPQGRHPTVIEWEEKNAYIMGDDPKASHAQVMYQKLAKTATSYEDLFERLDAEMAREFPDVNPRRNKQRSSEGGSPPGKPKASALTMRDLTTDEMSQVKNFGADWAPDGKGGYDESKILEMVAKARTEP